jgi:hypothetical protein
MMHMMLLLISRGLELLEAVTVQCEISQRDLKAKKTTSKAGALLAPPAGSASPTMATPLMLPCVSLPYAKRSQVIERSRARISSLPAAQKKGR